jgi:hypothetical protein
MRCACAAFGIKPPRILDYADGHLSEAYPEEVITQILRKDCSDDGLHIQTPSASSHRIVSEIRHD